MVQIHYNGPRVTVVNTSNQPVMLVSVTSPDQPNWLVSTGIEGEAEWLDPGQSFSFALAPDMSSAECHVVVEWMDSSEERHTAERRIRL